MPLRITRWLGGAALVIGYPLLAHYTNASASDPSLGAMVAIAPVMVVGFLLAWNSPHRWILTGAGVMACVALRAAWSVLETHFGVVYWLQDMGMLLVLLATFGRTLVAGREPLCTRFARTLYGSITQRHEIHARQVTIAWTFFFAAMALASTLLFFFAPLPIWSVFANFLTLPLVALMFVAEYGLRKLRLPEMRDMHILDAVRAFRNDAANPPSPSHSGDSLPT